VQLIPGLSFFLVLRFSQLLLPPFTVSDFSQAVEQVMADKYPAKKVFLAEANLNDGQRNRPRNSDAGSESPKRKRRSHEESGYGAQASTQKFEGT